MVDNIVEHQNDEFIPTLQLKEMAENADEVQILHQVSRRPMTKSPFQSNCELQVIQDPAFRAKVHFSVMEKIATAYMDISHDHIIGNFHEILQIGISNICEDDEEINRKQSQLDSLKRLCTSNVRSIIEQVNNRGNTSNEHKYANPSKNKRQKELHQDLRSIVEGSAQGLLTGQVEG